MAPNTEKIERNGRVFMIAYDQGLEHGPTDFNSENQDPRQIIKIALEGEASCVAMQYGLAKRFYARELRKQLPLVLKLNGKSALNSTNYKSAVLSGVEDALRLGAVGIGFTIFPGQTDEHIGFEQFAHVRRQAESAGLITVLWSYARGPEIKDQHHPDVVAYATRVAAELGADYAKVKYTGDPESMKWAVDVAAGTKVLISGTGKFGDDYPRAVADSLKSGASGIAVGRKIWQDKEPIVLAKRVAAKIYS